MNKKPKKRQAGFTLAELILALAVTGIITSALAGLILAVGNASAASESNTETQARIRYAMLKISDIIRSSQLVCDAKNNNIAFWIDKNGDNLITANELVYLVRSSERNKLRIATVSDSFPLTLANIKNISADLATYYGVKLHYLELFDNCSNVTFIFDKPPPFTEYVSISFEITDGNGQIKQFEIGNSLKARAENLLKHDGSGLITEN